MRKPIERHLPRKQLDVMNVRGEQEKTKIGRVLDRYLDELHEPEPITVCHNGVGEGIESTLSLMQLRQLPGWAALGTSGLRSLILPRAATRVLIAVDHDSNGAGEAAAQDVGRRWLLEDREVRLAMPTGLGDWNDVLKGRCDA